MYKTPTEHFLRLHFERSRFSRTFEDTLLILASRIVNIGMVAKEEFDTLLDRVIRETNTKSLKPKTVANRRTEMIRLFGLVKYADGLSMPGERLAVLTQTQDIPHFFKSFCKRFQFPGGFLKADKVSEMVAAGVKFKPARYILRMFKIAQSRHGEFAVSAAEVAHFIFNDKRVTVQQEGPDMALDKILEARKNGEKIDKTSDIIRYARDFLNYMVEANLLSEYKKMYALNEREANAIKSILADKEFFDGYSKVVRSDGSFDRDEYKKIDSEWMAWFADNGVGDDALQTPTAALVGENNFPDQWKKIKEMLERKDPSFRGAALKEIGDEGEKIAYEHEKDAVRKLHPTLVHMVRLVSSTAALGYDLLSVKKEDGRRKKYIEIKTTKKNYESGMNIPFTISINEWSVAQQLGDDYFIYRVIISKEGVSIFSIQNPAKKSEDGSLSVEPVGYKVVYSGKSGELLDM